MNNKEKRQRERVTRYTHIIKRKNEKETNTVKMKTSIDKGMKRRKKRRMDRQ